MKKSVILKIWQMNFEKNEKKAKKTKKMQFLVFDFVLKITILGVFDVCDKTARFYLLFF